MATCSRPAYREAYRHGAKRLAEADTFAALTKAMARRRKRVTVRMPNSGEAGILPCTGCGEALKAPAVGQIVADAWSLWLVFPRSHRALGFHHACSETRLEDMQSTGVTL